ncbi:hypothetical protein GCM10009126_17060 [Rhodanobacter caeni]|uniref:Uncharacterized protein n=1 Tax=Rhodanobacter caeni TaxID=657654 RepID=A0ABN0UJ35_9GAMM
MLVPVALPSGEARPLPAAIDHRRKACRNAAFGRAYIQKHRINTNGAARYREVRKSNEHSPCTSRRNRREP